MTKAAMRPPSTLIAIGGGGATHGTLPELDRFCLDRAPPFPRIGFVGMAERKNSNKFAYFRSAIAPLAAEVSKLRGDATGPEISDWIEALDVIYLGGGDPVHLVRKMKETGLHETLADASREGKILIGVSAGAMCWFEEFMWREPSGELGVASGLGAIAGAMTPHSLTQPERLIRMRELVSSGALEHGLAIDDGAAMVFRDGEPAETFARDGEAGVHRFAR